MQILNSIKNKIKIDDWMLGNDKKSLREIGKDSTIFSWNLAIWSSLTIFGLNALGIYPTLAKWIPDSLEILLLTFCYIVLPTQALLKEVIFYFKRSAIQIFCFYLLMSLMVVVILDLSSIYRFFNIQNPSLVFQFIFKGLIVIAIPTFSYLLIVLLATIKLPVTIIQLIIVKLASHLRIAKKMHLLIVISLLVISFILIGKDWQNIIDLTLAKSSILFKYLLQ